MTITSQEVVTMVACSIIGVTLFVVLSSILIRIEGNGKNGK